MGALKRVRLPSAAVGIALAAAHAHFVLPLMCGPGPLAAGQEVSVKLQDGAAKGLYNLDFISEMPMLCFVLKMALADKPSDRPTLLGLKRLMKLGGLWLSESVRRLYEWWVYSRGTAQVQYMLANDKVVMWGA